MTSPRKPISSEQVQIFHRDALTTVLHRQTWNVNLIEKQSTITKSEFESWNFITITIHLAVFFIFVFLSYRILHFGFLPIIRKRKKITENYLTDRPTKYFESSGERLGLQKASPRENSLKCFTAIWSLEILIICIILKRLHSLKPDNSIFVGDTLINKRKLTIV